MITGVIAAIGTPSLMGMLQGDQVEQGLNQIQLALQDAQKQAIRNSKKCTIKIKSDGSPNIDVEDDASKHCLGGVERDLPDSVAMTMTGGLGETTIKFSFKGNMSGGGKTIVVKPEKGTGDKKCLVITQGLGIMRTGFYDPTQNDSDPKAEHCYKSYQALKNK